MRFLNFIRLSVRVGMLAAFCAVSLFGGMDSVQAESSRWNDSQITAQGVGVMPKSKKNSSSMQKKLKAKVTEMAKDNLKKDILGLRLAEEIVIDEETASSVADRSTVLDEQTDANGSVIITVGVPVYGKNSLAEIVFKPATKIPFPSPNNGNEKAQGHYTALVIDCTEWEDAHKEFIANRKASGKEIKHFNDTLNYAVMTSQEKEIELNYLEDIKLEKETGKYIVSYEEHSDLTQLPLKDTFFKAAK